MYHMVEHFSSSQETLGLISSNTQAHMHVCMHAEARRHTHTHTYILA